MAVSKENMVEITTKVNIRYDKASKKAGEKLKIRESDLEEFKKKGYIKYINQDSIQDSTPPQNPPADGK
ncbi:hypothetical protein KM799_12865 [Clostridium tyrobutyricum]|uniref:DUF7210 family protein n=1 Tax=Clostridium tyrobutyricum TaxID=1519 RepID=UPI0010AAE92E|nr:hypothetical protein [Clostridium tyrobutyricum]MBV4447497.1 hypothetical protein [Clostridium tyrobutyricum]QCH28468.1 hypothetical protein EZN00_02072 [Clostridium tyrobutyricum]